MKAQLLVATGPSLKAKLIGDDLLMWAEALRSGTFTSIDLVLLEDDIAMLRRLIEVRQARGFAVLS